VEPQVIKTGFGWITLGADRYNHDIVIGLDGIVRKRRKKLSKQVYGTSHKISLAEARDVLEEGCEVLLISAGVFGRVGLSDEAKAYFDGHSVQVVVLPTQQAVRRWNAMTGKAVGLFHVTC
jgi:hypothetical protein